MRCRHWYQADSSFKNFAPGSFRLMTFFHKVRIGRKFFQLGEPRRWIIFKRFQHDTLPYATNADSIALEAKFPGQAHSLAASVLKKLGELGHFCHVASIYLMYILSKENL